MRSQPPRARAAAFVLAMLLAEPPDPSFFDGPCQRHPPCLEVSDEELYDLDADPFEMSNLLDAPLAEKGGEALARLRGLLDAQLNLRPAYRRRLNLAGESSESLDEDQEEALRALGYLE